MTVDLHRVSQDEKDDVDRLLTELENEHGRTDDEGDPGPG
jgi:hypothetical protein